MKANGYFTEYDYYRRYFNNHERDVQQSEDLIDAGAQALNAATKQMTRGLVLNRLRSKSPFP